MRGKPLRGYKLPVAKMTTREIAAVLGCSHGTVQNLLNSALRKLRRGLADWAPE